MRRYALPIAGLILFILAMVALYHELSALRWGDIRAALAATPGREILLALGLTALNYLSLGTIDLLAVRATGHRLPWQRPMLAGLLGYGISNTLGQSWLSGGSIRYRLYTSWGLPAADVVKIVGYNIFTFTLGALTLGGAVALLRTGEAAAILPLGPTALRGAGAGCLALVTAWIGWAGILRRPFQLLRLRAPPPPPGIALAQVLVGCLDISLIAAILYTLLPPTDVGFPAFLVLYILAFLSGIVSMVPGGLGVFEVVLVKALSPQLPADGVMGALLAFRAIYFLLPLLAATLGLVILESRRPRAPALPPVDGPAPGA